MAIDVVGYPEPRPAREGPAIITPAGDAQPAGALPNTRVYWVHNSTLAGTRTTSSTGRLIGPAIIRRWVARANNATNPPNLYFEPGYAPTPVDERNVPLTTAKPYTPLFDRMEPSSIGVSPLLSGFPSSTLIGATDHGQFDLDYIVPLPEFYLALANINNLAVPVDWVGYFTVVERVSVEALRNFL